MPPRSSPLTIKLPSVFGTRRIHDMFRVCEQIGTSSGDIVLDATETTFFDPLGIALLGATLEPLVGLRNVRMDWLRSPIGGYLSKMGVIDRCALEGIEAGPFQRDELSDSSVELTRVFHEHEVDEAADRLAVAVAGKLVHDDRIAVADDSVKATQFEAFRRPLRYALSELLLNALSHAKREGRHSAAVWVAAQFYVTSGVVRLAVVDNGCGILETLRNSPRLREKSHIAAIPMALEAFVTCNPDLGLPGGTANQGVGLTTTHQIAKAARGGLTIVSGNAGVLAHSEVKPFELEAGANWPGVAILMSCRRSLIPSINVPQLLPGVADIPDVRLRFIP